MNITTDKKQIIVIRPANQQLVPVVEVISRKLQDYIIVEDESDIPDSSIIIFITPNGISMGMAGNTSEKPVFIDFSGKKMQYRQRNSGTRKEALARAVGLKSGQPINIIDATAGLGGDSFILATLGANVLMFERNPIVHLLLEDAINRANAYISLKAIMERMELINGDTITFLEKIDLKPDVIYMDPMFPDKTKTALSKKEMRLFREIAGADEDIGQLFTKALQNAKKRVVVKRPLRAGYVNNIKPHFDISGASSRFDVYMI